MSSGNETDVAGISFLRKNSSDAKHQTGPEERTGEWNSKQNRWCWKIILVHVEIMRNSFGKIFEITTNGIMIFPDIFSKKVDENIQLLSVAASPGNSSRVLERRGKKSRPWMPMHVHAPWRPVIWRKTQTDIALIYYFEITGVLKKKVVEISSWATVLNFIFISAGFFQKMH